MGMDVYGRNPKNETGEYFRANVWGWRPIHFLCGFCVEKHEVETGYDDLIPEKTFDRMSENSGAGLRSDRKCNLLANHLKYFVDETFSKGVWHQHSPEVGSTIGVNEDNDFYIDFHNKMYVGSPDPVTGGCKFLTDEELKDPNVEKHSPYTVEKEDIEEFIVFLKNCGGFQVC